MGNGNFIQTAEQAMAGELSRLRDGGASKEDLAKAASGLGPAGEVWCLAVADGQIAWKYRTPRVVLGAAAADDREVYVADRAGTVHHLSLEGRLLGTWSAHAPVLASPALTDSLVYIVTEAGSLFALERGSLRPVWEVAVGDGSPFISSPAIARGHVYVGTPSSGIVCLGQPRGAEPDPIWQGHLGGPGRAGAVEPSVLSRRGSLLWRYPGGDTTGIRVTAPAACLGKRLLVPVAEGAQKGVICLPHETRSRETPEPLWHFETPRGAWSSPATDGRLAVFVDGRQGDDGRKLHAVDVPTGTEIWNLPVSADATGCLLLDRSGLLVGSSARGLTSLTLGGEVLWTRKLGAIRHSPVTVESLTVAAVDSPQPELLLLDRPCGKVLWRTGLESPGIAGPLVRGHDILLATSRGVAARRLVDGAIVWRVEVGKVTSPLAAAGDWVAGITDAGVLVRLDSRTGEVLEEVRGALPDTSLLLARDVLLYPSRQGLTLYRPGSGSRPRRWMAVSWLGAITAPPITAGDRVYFATDAKGLICAGEW
jgi:outer membrane protein assembly factor BamB